MKNITNMSVIQGRIFAPDAIPYRLITTPSGTNFLKEIFGFGSAALSQENWDYVFQDGTLERKGEGGVVPITWVGFNDRRIVVQVLGDSADAHAVYLAISERLVELYPGFRNAAPLVFNEETSCVARLDFEWTALLSPVVIEQIAKLVGELSTEDVRRIIKNVNVRFTLGSVASDNSLREYGITLYDPTVIIEPRADVPLSERFYFTSSPCDSDAHLKFVSELETRLSQSKKLKGRAPK